jgi:hypothetical protein
MVTSRSPLSGYGNRGPDKQVNVRGVPGWVHAKLMAKATKRRWSFQRYLLWILTEVAGERPVRSAEPEPAGEPWPMEKVLADSCEFDDDADALFMALAAERPTDRLVTFARLVEWARAGAPAMTPATAGEEA